MYFNPLTRMLYSSHLQKCEEKTHTFSHQNAAGQSGSQMVQLTKPIRTQLYYKRFSRGIPIFGNSG